VIGIDTNVLVRYIAQDDPVQSPRATALIEGECSADRPGFVTLVTLVETVWVSESCYDAGRKDIASMVRLIMGAKQLQVQDAETVWKALRVFESGSADFSDCLVAETAAAAGCERTVTFDKKAAKAGMSLLR
jgi:predicted nucleic-acid-binding protein